MIDVSGNWSLIRDCLQGEYRSRKSLPLAIIHTPKPFMKLERPDADPSIRSLNMKRRSRSIFL
jgi:hypothetical protein